MIPPGATRTFVLLVIIVVLFVMVALAIRDFRRDAKRPVDEADLVSPDSPVGADGELRITPLTPVDDEPWREPRSWR